MIATLLASGKLGFILVYIVAGLVLIAQRKMLSGRDEEDTPPE